eukprot:gene11339-biopygen12790
MFEVHLRGTVIHGGASLSHHDDNREQDQREPGVKMLRVMDGDAELDALLAKHPAARAAYERRIERLSPTRTWTDVVIRALATLVNSPMDEQQFAKALLEEFVIGATTQNIDAMNGLVRGMFTGVRRNCSTTMLEVDDATAVTLKSGAVPNSSARSLWTQLTSWR